MPKDSDMRALKNAAVEDDDSDDYDHNNAHGDHDEDDHCEGIFFSKIDSKEVIFITMIIRQKMILYTPVVSMMKMIIVRCW